jgi:hypothetical protein
MQPAAAAAAPCPSQPAATESNVAMMSNPSTNHSLDLFLN